ncbi:uncharacterized protein AFUA_5G10440 [Aspergillus fumigatus Af293]|uniref:Uncharacterized protein n=2 Tax=Aspergillus fumigatus TaxID=746128 RepID=Q4WV15_ASPFU|nr:hypothetical protein AFUA_5G10440 [Aspergillus fumigatus Af293]EAL91561.1 hypothetical protein AFUA_5G10440 [Aspergillus fumigatus Af293]EDP51784.1 hypothetical protein AFUB_058030 [Aspergillus fumigatus A1163]
MRSFRNSLHDPCTIATNRALSNTQWHKTSGMQENMRATTPLELESRAQPGHQSKLLPALFLGLSSVHPLRRINHALQ